MSDIPSSMEELKEQLRSYGQEHVLHWWEDLSQEEKEELRKDLGEVDLQEMQEMWEKTCGQEVEVREVDDVMEPVEASLCESVATSSEEILKEYEEVALRAASRGQMGVLLLAGGQGTRLGVGYPKGMYDIGLLSGKTLYQIQVERILRLQELSERLTGTKTIIPMYIMTSEATKEDTADFFSKHNYFGLKQNQVVIFEQRVIPSFDNQGKFIMSRKSKLARSPDGNGGLYWALQNEGVLDDMERRDIRYLHAYCVDNVLVKVADPHFMGYCISKNAESGNKVVEKVQPAEAVGVVCKVDGKIQVVEYSEISKQNSEMRNSNGQLTYHAGNICNHFFTRDFLRKICSDHLRDLPHHIAKKKIPHVDLKSGDNIKPEKPNGIKLEKFVFDVFEFSSSFVVWVCERDDEFSPLKNAEGAGKDTPTTARESLYDLHKRYIKASGAKLVFGSDTSLEICPLLSYAGEGLEEIHGKSLDTPLHLDKGAAANGTH